MWNKQKIYETIKHFQFCFRFVRVKLWSFKWLKYYLADLGIAKWLWFGYRMVQMMSKCIAYGRWLQQVGLGRRSSRRSRNSRRLARGPDRGAMQCNHLAIWWGTGGIGTRKVHGPRKSNSAVCAARNAWVHCAVAGRCREGKCVLVQYHPNCTVIENQYHICRDKYALECKWNC